VKTRLRASLAAASFALLLPTTALANGRFPAAGQVVVDPSDPTRIVLRATYGLLQSTDSGQSWQWVCEQALGYNGVEDPAVGVMQNGTIIAGIFEGLTQSPDRGCSWSFAPGALAGQYVVDTAVDPSNPSRAVAVTSTTVGGGINVVIAETTDDGATWNATGPALDPQFRALTIEVAPSNPNRLYVSGVQGASGGMLMRSDDRGKTWTALPFALAGATGEYVSAVDPANADRLWVRVDGIDQDVLEVSTDAGTTFTPVATVQGEMLGFALSPDAKSVAIGGPSAGLSTASTNDHKFTQVSSVGVRCLKWHATGIYACGDEGTDHFTLARSTDQGASFTPLYHIADTKLLSCPASTPSGNLCPAAWPSVANQIGADPTISKGGSGSGGGGAGGSTPKEDSGCATSSTGVSSGLDALVVVVVGVIALGRRRAR
jgi:hypothetical protein